MPTRRGGVACRPGAAATLLLPLLTAVPGLATTDPRIPLVELQLEGKPADALARVEATLAADPESRRLGLDYLRGHLLEELDRPADAHRAFARAMAEMPELADYSLYRLALNQSRTGHPELAAGLLARLLSGRPPQPLVGPATDLLVAQIGGGGDCDLLEDLDEARLPSVERRKLELARARCARGEAEAILLRLVSDGAVDETARQAAALLHLDHPDAVADTAAALDLGRVFHHHRQFGLAIRYLTAGLDDRLRGNEPLDEKDADAVYALARSHFWREEYLLASSWFGQLAARLPDPADRARPLYQQARCYELRGNWDVAANNYRLAYTADPEGDWAGPALLAALRLEWRLGSEETALELYRLLTGERRWLGLASRAGLFLAASDLVRQRTDRARVWLDEAARWRGVSQVELTFWRARHAHLQGRRLEAVRSLLATAARAPYHPLGREARAWLAHPDLDATAIAEGVRLAGSASGRDLVGAWILLGDGRPEGRRARQRLERALRDDRRARAFLDLASPPPREWPLWQSALQQPEEKLLALGVWSQGSSAMLKHFPVADVSLGFTASRLLAQAQENRRSLYVAEILQKRVPAGLPPGLLPLELRRLLYPLPYRELIETESRRQRIDPALLAAIIREESRFDPQVVSSAAARGLTQFVLPTARRLAGRLGLEQLEASDLHDPVISIALGAAYLRELDERFEGRESAVVAAYNAGERQAELWSSYCYSSDPAEYLTKVSFAETRRYLEKVLSSRGQYAEIYLPPALEVSAAGR
ncbi:MAG: lytic transglycosylase domain-containing protein [Thermoanaerobaculia bacterium]|nr:lytic transglycosylase domain-containing protein [Thermoanaerobaculia bacterium]